MAISITQSPQIEFADRLGVIGTYNTSSPGWPEIRILAKDFCYGDLNVRRRCACACRVVVNGSLGLATSFFIRLGNKWRCKEVCHAATDESGQRRARYQRAPRKLYVPPHYTAQVLRARGKRAVVLPHAFGL
jgi:hypothetical protein